MQTITTIGLDIAKSVFQVHGVDAEGNVILRRSAGQCKKNAIAGAAEALKVTLEIVEVRTPSDFDEAFISASRDGAGALLMLSSPLISANVQKLAELAILHKLPTITLFPDFARAEGLMAYGPNLLGAIQQAGGMIGKILQGTSPADLPIERPTKFELVINLKTAKVLGLDVPPTVDRIETPFAAVREAGDGPFRQIL
jgi:putative ABC transport system substrate-binding protein